MREKTLNMIGFVNKYLETFLFILLEVIITTMFITVLAAVASRYFSLGIAGLDELARYLLVWSVFLGAALAVRFNDHLTVDFLVNKIKGAMKQYITLFTVLFMLIFIAIICICLGCFQPAKKSSLKTAK